MKRLYLGVGLVTLATLLYELLLTRIYSVTLYYHFAFLVISVALFGLGLSGVRLYLGRARHPRERLCEQLAHNARMFAITGLVGLLYVLHHSVTANLDAIRPTAFSWQNFFELAFIYAFSAAPFYFGGMVVSLALYHLRERAATVYFFDLVGASAACLLLDPLLRWLGGPNAALVTLLLVAATAVLFGGDERRFARDRRSIALVAGLALLLLFNLAVGAIDVGAFKEVETQDLAFSKWNAFSRIEVQENPGQPPSLTIDGMARTLIVSRNPAHPSPRNKGITTLVHAVRPHGKMLIIGPGGGIDVLAALRAGHESITLAEINPTILYDVMLGQYREHSGELYAQPQVHPNLAEGRSFVRRSTERFDVIQATLVDTWAATAAGAFALTENHLYTVDAFGDYLEHLTPDGILTMSRWVHVEGMEFVRLTATARAALERRGVKQAYRHLVAAFSGPLATLLVKRTPFTDAEIEALHRRCAADKFTLLFSPRFHPPNNPVSFLIGTRDLATFYARFPIDIRPVHDDRPFFFYPIKPERALATLFGGESYGLNSFSLQVLAALALLVTLLVLGAIVVPLWIGGRGELREQLGSKLRDLGYFVCIGVGFIVIEIGLLSRLTLYLGHPIHALRVVFFGMLFFGGLGSLLSGRARSAAALRLQLLIAASGTALIVGLYAVELGALLHATLGRSLGARMALALGLVAAPALLMGMMLPTGIRLLSARHPQIVPWAWGLNGAASVFGSVLAMVLALHVGFTVTLACGAGAYLLALLFGLRSVGHSS